MSKSRILVVEDQVVLQYVAKRQLGLLGYEPDFAEDGIKAVQMAVSSKYDIVFMDVMLPEMDGLKATGLIREAEQVSGTRTPIIGMTAYSLRDKCLEAGMDDFLQKPVMLEQLEKVLLKWLPEGSNRHQKVPSSSEFQQTKDSLLSVQERLANLRKRLGLEK
ncbi:MAG: response regulator [Candidatus Obscuribacterales bacterium]|nr:response regulator [Candidatus Obscuribacterales bacterium]